MKDELRSVFTEATRISVQAGDGTCRMPGGAPPVLSWLTSRSSGSHASQGRLVNNEVEDDF
jgi:hypothetical protein